MNKFFAGIALFFLCSGLSAQTPAFVPPMGWMSWNSFSDRINEQAVREMADVMASNGMLQAGYQYILIDDCWQGGRDAQNNIIADPRKFPSGIKALADYIHNKGLKLGIYSDAAPLTCAGYTGSLNFEEQEAKTFAAWGVDYLKYDYCNAPADSATAKVRYHTMAEALRKSGRDMVFSICEWGDRQPWKWAAKAGGQLWRTTGDIRDKWTRKAGETSGEGIMEIVDVNAELPQYAKPGHWNDPDALMVGLYGKKGPSGDLGGIGCSNTEYQSQMSLWSIMAAPLFASNDLRQLNYASKRIFLNKEVIAIDQDALGKQAERKIKDDIFNVFVKPLQNGDYAIAILNRSDVTQNYEANFKELGLTGSFEIRDLWQHRVVGMGNKWKGSLQSHETKLFRLKGK